MSNDLRRTPFTVMECLLGEMGDPDWIHPDKPLVQLSQDWHAFPDTRKQFLASVPPDDADPLHVLKIAAVVHGLCDYSGCEVPAWVMRHRAEQEFQLFWMPGLPLVTERVREAAADACAYHGVWYEARFVYPKRHGLVNPFKGMSQEEFRGMLNIIEPEPRYAHLVRHR